MKTKQGILTGCDTRHEWMLKWWWKSYKKTNTHPVTFIDFGMSKAAKIWCAKQGEVIPLRKKHLMPAPAWISSYAYIKRQTWLSKPAALLKTPYEKTIWIDMDAEVKRPLNDLFTLCPEKTFALCYELPFRAQAERKSQLIPKKAPSFNTGVIVYPRKAPLLTLWEKETRKTSSLGDQDLLSRLIFEKNISIELLPSKFNKIHPMVDEGEVVIYHYASKLGQLALLEKLKHWS